MLGLHTASSFKAAVEEIKQHCVVTANVLPLAEMMETLRVQPYRSLYPRVRPEGREDDQWHAVQRSSNPAVPSMAHFLDGYAVAFQPGRAIYLCVNGTKRAFPNMDTLTGMGYDMSMVVRMSMKDAEFRGIPDGPDLPPVAGRRLRVRF